MNIFIDTEAMRFVTEKELRQEFEQLKREQPENMITPLSSTYRTAQARMAHWRRHEGIYI